MYMDMKQLINSMENTMKLQNRARAQRRAEEADRAKKEFQEKLMHAAINKIELDRLASKNKGADDSVQRDQLVSLMTSAINPF